jgi:hypothetical protein
LSSTAIFCTVGSVGRAWALQILDGSGRPVDMTYATSVTFSMRQRGGTVRKIDNRPAEVANGTYTLPDGSTATYTPADGILIYQPVAGDVDTDGQFSGQFTYQMAGKPVVDPGAGYVDIILQLAV